LAILSSESAFLAIKEDGVETLYGALVLLIIAAISSEVIAIPHLLIHKMKHVYYIKYINIINKALNKLIY